MSFFILNIIWLPILVGILIYQVYELSKESRE